MGTYIDLSGKKFGKWLVISRDSNIDKKNIYWVCQCECGCIRSVAGTSLRKGTSVSCGCEKNKETAKRTIERVEDMTGSKFGKWTVLKRDLSGDSNSKRGARWICQCDCGTIRSVLGYSLRTGKTTSCGCQRANKSKHSSKNESLIGKKFGFLTVIEIDKEKKGSGVFWKCICDCGNVKSYRTNILLSGKVVSCGCNNRKKSSDRKFIDMTNQRFGKLTIICLDHKKTDNQGNSKYYWKCICDCGNEKIVEGSVLRRGDTKSCGCFQKSEATKRAKERTIDFIGKRFGLLTVIERVPVCEASEISTWKCICDCGNVKFADGYYLRKGMISSCGCLAQSKYELYVLQYFNKKNYISSIDYETQKRFDDLRGVEEGLLSYDFAFYKNNKLFAFIECQGQQHYEPIEFFGGKEQFAKQQLHDELKKFYAKSIGIPLIEIPYTVESYNEVENILKNFGI
ncbi:MAG: hypothetical protein IIX14_08695 [Clostridia bacterium]|nr:hypothetical protein [Clostridia bacterium]